MSTLQSNMSSPLIPTVVGPYSDAAHLHAATATSSGGYSAAYDAAGDLTCRAPNAAVTCVGGSPTGAVLGYNNERRMTSWQSAPSNPGATASYAYDGEGHRVAQSVAAGGTTTTTYYIAGLEEQANVSGGTSTLTKYYSVPGVVSAVNVGGTLSLLASDGLGSVSEALSATSAAATSQQLYGPYGGLRYATGSMPTAKGYTGQYADVASSGLDYYGARYYDPLVGQFASADSAADGLNRYGYVAGNAETATDPSGHCGGHNLRASCGGGDGGGDGGGGHGGGGGKGGGCKSEHCGNDRTTYDCTNLAVAEAVSACDAYTSAVANDNRARDNLLADELHHAAWLIFLGTILGGIVDFIELIKPGGGVVTKIKALVDLAFDLAGGFYWLSIAQGSKAGSPLVSNVLRVLNAIATVGNSLIAMFRELGAAAQWAIDKGWIAFRGMAAGVPGLLANIAVWLAGDTVLDLLSGGFHAMLSQGFQLYADYQSQENMDIGAWCAAHASAQCEPIPSSVVSL